jgi:hypothetical protein
MNTIVVSIILALSATAALAEPLPVPSRQGGSCPNGYLSSGSYCVPSSSRQDAIPKPPKGPSQHHCGGFNSARVSRVHTPQVDNSARIVTKSWWDTLA